MAIAFVRATNAQSKTAGTTLAVPITAPATGNLLVCAFASDPTTGTYSCADNTGTTWTALTASTNGSATTGVRTQIFYRLNAPNTVTTVTVTLPSTTARAAVVSEFSGVATTAAFDKEAGATGSPSPYDSGVVATTAQADELLIGAWGYEAPFNDLTTARTTSDGVAGSYTIPLQTSPGTAGSGVGGTSGGGAGSNVTIVAGYEVVSATGAYKASLALTFTYNWAARIATFKAGSSAAALAATGAGQATGSATGLVETNTLAATGAAQATGTGTTLGLTAVLAGTGAGQTTGAASPLTLTQPLAATGAATATGAGTALTQTQPLAATGAGAATGAAAFAGAGAILAATGAGLATATADLTTAAVGAVLAATGAAQATGAATALRVTQALGATGTGAATGAATTLRLTQPLAGTGAGLATATGTTLAQTQPLAATGAAAGTGTADLSTGSTGATLAASGTATATGTAALRLTAILTGQGAASATGTAGLTPGAAGAALAASGTATATGTAGLTPGPAGAILAATGSATATGAATGLRLPRALAATGSATATGAATLTAFAQLTLGLTVGDHGAVTGNAGLYVAGTPAVLTAIPDPGWQLGVWYVDGVPGGTANPLTLPMLANRQVGAVFIPGVVRHEADTWHWVP